MDRAQDTVDHVRVWDPFVRVFHWSLAILFFVAYFSEDDLLTIHVWAGYLIGALAIMRIIWGFIGPRHARFSDFVTGPWMAWRYLLDLLARRAARHLGHSPAGGFMVLLLLAGLLALVWSGMEVHALNNGAGPLAGASVPTPPTTGTRPSLADALVPRALANGDERERREKHRNGADDDAWEDIHEVLANVVMALVILHVAGVLLASLVHRENLTRAMVTGFKRRAT